MGSSNVVYFRPWWRNTPWHPWLCPVIDLAFERAKRSRRCLIPYIAAK